MRNKLKQITISLLAAMAGTAAVVSVASWLVGSPLALRAQNIPPVTVSEAPLSRDVKVSTSLAPVVKKAAPSVVTIYSSKTVKNPRGMGPGGFPFGRFFGEPDEDEDGNSARRGPRTRKERGLGSGVIVSKDGYILTNNHVVDGADEVKVSLAHDKKEYVARVIGKDPRTDIAVVKIDTKDLPAITLADSDKVEVGDLSLAIGNPFGVGQTVTMGIVSATGRGDLGVEVYEDYIQTDASINPGNSGGALVDAEGRLIGVPTFIFSRSGGNQGVGFAVPVNQARAVMNQLIKDGKVTRGFLGVMPRDITPELAAKFHAPENSGVLISEVEENSAAEEAGIRVGDVITEVNGKSVPDSRRFRLGVSQSVPGAKVELKLLRDGKTKVVKATLKELKESRVSANGRPQPDADGESDALNGVTVGDINSRARAQFNIPASLKGALIIEMDPDSASAEAGLKVGDVILEIERKAVQNANDAVELSKRVEGKKVLVRLWSRGHTDYIVVDEGKK